MATMFPNQKTSYQLPYAGKQEARSTAIETRRFPEAQTASKHDISPGGIYTKI
jgi:hypothetical protein